MAAPNPQAADWTTSILVADVLPPCPPDIAGGLPRTEYDIKKVPAVEVSIAQGLRPWDENKGGLAPLGTFSCKGKEACLETRLRLLA
jgi:hypothetical protein